MMNVKKFVVQPLEFTPDPYKHRVAEKMRSYFEMGTDGVYVFNSELLVDFEGTFGGYLYKCLFV